MFLMFLVGISLAFTSPYVDLGNLNRIWTDFGEADEPTSCFWFRMTASNFSCTWKDRILALTCGEAGHCKRYTYYIILYYIILYYSILYYSILYYIILTYIYNMIHIQSYYLGLPVLVRLSKVGDSFDANLEQIHGNTTTVQYMGMNLVN